MNLSSSSWVLPLLCFLVNVRVFQLVEPIKSVSKKKWTKYEEHYMRKLGEWRTMASLLMTDNHELKGLEQSWLSKIGKSVWYISRKIVVFIRSDYINQKENFHFWPFSSYNLPLSMGFGTRIHHHQPSSEHSKSSWKSNANVAKFKLESGPTGKKSRPRCEKACAWRGGALQVRFPRH